MTESSAPQAATGSGRRTDRDSRPAGGPDPRAGAQVGSAAGAPVEVASYEQARDELTSVVGRLESGGLSLDESLTLWERGEHLAAVCAKFLDGARERVETALAKVQDGVGGPAPADF